ncbi:hypothetical protein F183_A20740 [Bryobacterales bacterium F-183]|nr:hypothetical protein F183_A20740 [Bryobacterales bacterium F-183]
MLCLVAIVAAAESRVVRGVVVDGAGHAVDGARVFQSSDLTRVIGVASAEGAFAVTADSPVLVVRRAGYRSAILRIAEAEGDVRLVLRGLPNYGAFAECSWAADGGTETTVTFRLPGGESPGLERGEVTGLSPHEELYEDATYRVGRLDVVASRWQSADRRVVGRQLVVAGMGGIHYRGVSLLGAWRADAGMDGVCLDAGKLKQKTFAVTVRDEEGAPVADATAGHTGFRPEVKSQTDGKIRARLWGPVAVIRKPGYESAVWNGSVDTVTLRRLPNGGGMPKCAANARYVGGARVRIRLPRDMAENPLVVDVDHERRYYVVRGRDEESIQHGNGPMWSLGDGPGDREVWDTTAFQERVYSDNGWPIFDYRGRDAQGKYFRKIDTFSESVSYRTSDAGVAALFDRVLDSACDAGGGRRVH